MNSNKSWSNTSVELENISHTWTVENFSRLLDGSTSKRITSPQFSSDGNDHQFSLNLELKGLVQDFTTWKFGTLHIQLTNHSNSLFKFKANMWLEGQLKCQDWINFSVTDPYIVKSIAFDEFEKQKNTILINDKLIINCEIAFIKTCVKKYGQNVKVPNCKLAQDFGAALEAKKFTDVTIVTGDDHKIPVHKMILSGK